MSSATKSSKTARSSKFAQTWLLEPIECDPTFETRRMFGGLAVYLGGRMVLVLMESDPSDLEYRGKKFDFPIWSGLLIPTDRTHHDSLLRDFSDLRVHPVLGKWLYLVMQDDYEKTAQEIVDAIGKGGSRFGIEPGTRARKRKKVIRVKSVRKRLV